MNLNLTDRRLLGFMHYLRGRGYRMTMGEITDAARALRACSRQEDTVRRQAIRSIVCRDREEWSTFNSHFDRYWSGEDQTIVETAKRFLSSSRKSITAQVGLAGATDDNHVLERESAELTGSGAGRQKSISKADFRFLNDRAAMRQVEYLVEQLAKQLKRRLTRRYVQRNYGKQINLRKTFRQSMAYGGTPVKPVFNQRKQHFPHIILLHDVSHSMTWNNPLLFRFARGIIRAFPNTSEAFVFHTRLFCVTTLYREASVAVMKQRLEEKNHLWMGGTSINGSVTAFMNHHGDVLRPDSLVLIISDGFDTDEPAKLGDTLACLGKRCKRILWLNPMLGREGYTIDNEFTDKVQPQLDLLAPAHSLDALRHTVHFIDRTCR